MYSRRGLPKHLSNSRKGWLRKKPIVARSHIRKKSVNCCHSLLSKNTIDWNVHLSFYNSFVCPPDLFWTTTSYLNHTSCVPRRRTCFGSRVNLNNPSNSLVLVNLAWEGRKKGFMGTEKNRSISGPKGGRGPFKV